MESAAKTLHCRNCLVPRKKNTANVKVVTTEELQAVHDALPPEGGVIVIPAGTYLIENNVTENCVFVSGDDLSPAPIAPEAVEPPPKRKPRLRCKSSTPWIKHPSTPRSS